MKGEKVGSTRTCSHTSSHVSFQRGVQPSRLTERVVYVAPSTYGWPSPTAQEKLPPPCSSTAQRGDTGGLEADGTRSWKEAPLSGMWYRSHTSGFARCSPGRVSILGTYFYDALTNDAGVYRFDAVPVA